MRAIRAAKPHDLQWIELPKPEIEGPKDVQIRVRAAGVCGSDIGIWNGSNSLATYPRVLGHEIAGEVEAVGSEVGGLKVGDHVCLDPISYCGKCYACRQNRPNVCKDLKVYGVHRDGGYCEYLVADEARFHKVPDSLTFEQSVMIEPFTIAAQNVWRANVQAGDVVLIHGAGPIGLILTDTAKRLGATVIVSEINEHRLGVAKEFGADFTINPNKEEFLARVEEITGGMGPNVIFEATGVPALLTQAVELVSEAGRIVPLAFTATPIPVSVALINKKELAILGTRLQTNKFAPVIETFEQKLDHVNRMITGTYPAEQFQQAFEDFVDPTSTHCKVILTF